MTASIGYPGQPVEILLVEDNPDDVELTLHAMRKHRIASRIHVVRDGAEALDYLLGTGFSETAPLARDGALAPKIIILDMKLPKLDGKEVLRSLKNNPRTRMIPVVVLSSSREERDIVDAYALGVNSYIVKPVDFEQFSHAVSQIGFYWLLLNQPPAGVL
jgi:two-component system response regulator